MASDVASAAQPKPKKSNTFALNLKKEMQFVRDESKKSQKYLQILEQQGFVVDNMVKHVEIVSSIKEAQNKAERCIETLMSDTSNNKISNTEELLSKILGFQDTLRTATEVLSSMPVEDNSAPTDP